MSTSKTMSDYNANWTIQNQRIRDAFEIIKHESMTKSGHIRKLASPESQSGALSADVLQPLVASGWVESPVEGMFRFRIDPHDTEARECPVCGGEWTPSDGRHSDPDTDHIESVMDESLSAGILELAKHDIQLSGGYVRKFTDSNKATVHVALSTLVDEGKMEKYGEVKGLYKFVADEDDDESRDCPICGGEWTPSEGLHRDREE